MTNLLWPGDHRAGELMSDATLLSCMVAVESAWLDALVAAGLAPGPCAGADLTGLINSDDCALLAAESEDGGNPVLGLVTLLRDRASTEVSRWIHRGLTSQDVLDTGLMLASRAVVDEVISQLTEHVCALSRLAATHRHTPMVARTLTQHAVPTTFGVKAASWCDGVVDAYQRLGALSIPVQVGGAGGTLAATTELAALAGHSDPVSVSIQLGQTIAATVGLDFRMPWHTSRAPITAIGDALIGCTDAWGRIASDLVTLARPEIGEVSEPAAENRGASSSLPQKRNPVLAILIRRAAIATPALGATLHTAAALANDERPDGSWHAEWETLRLLARRTVVAGSQCAELLAGLEVHPAQMSANLAGTDVLSEQRAVAELVGKRPSDNYFGAADALIDESLDRAKLIVKERP